jgi:23S rRNA (cytosine1962-C5)-methyltransferase
MASQRPLAPDPAAPMPAVFVKSSTWHPLLYRKRIERADRAQPGDLCAIYGSDRALQGYGLFNPRSEIGVRMLWHTAELPDDAAWDTKLREAVALRHDLLRLPETADAYRLIHAESDGLSGLMVDKLGDVLSAEAFSLGMYQRGEAILQRLAEMCGTKHWLLQASPQFLSQEGCEPPVLASPELPGQINIREYGTRFRVRFAEGHKTGFFCDQRENRRQLATFCEGKSVLDLCCYTGGFSVQAKKLGNASEVTGIDLDAAPLQLAKENANLNQCRVRFVQADAFAYMRDMLQSERRWDVVVLDPPKLIRNREEIEEGTGKHYALNRMAMQLVKPGGLLLSCSCAGLLSEPDFIQLVCSAARNAGPTDEATGRGLSRKMKIIARTGAGPDHPVASNCLETDYLKAIWMVME